MKQAYPLAWPLEYQRTAAHKRKNSQFSQSMEKAQQFLRNETDKIGGKELIISTNLRVRQDGGLYAADLIKLNDDPGVAIYFKYKGEPVSMCCDQYIRVWENIYALGKAIEALRGIERWGVSDFIARSFTGFKALPEAAVSLEWIWPALGLNGKPAVPENIHIAYRTLAKIHHPDIPGGSREKFDELQEAYKIAKQILNQ